MPAPIAEPTTKFPLGHPGTARRGRACARDGLAAVCGDGFADTDADAGVQHTAPDDDGPRGGGATASAGRERRDCARRDHPGVTLCRSLHRRNGGHRRSCDAASRPLLRAVTSVADLLSGTPSRAISSAVRVPELARREAPPTLAARAVRRRSARAAAR